MAQAIKTLELQWMVEGNPMTFRQDFPTFKELIAEFRRLKNAGVQVKCKVETLMSDGNKPNWFYIINDWMDVEYIAYPDGGSKTSGAFGGVKHLARTLGVWF